MAIETNGPGYMSRNTPNSIAPAQTGPVAPLTSKIYNAAPGTDLAPGSTVSGTFDNKNNPNPVINPSGLTPTTDKIGQTNPPGTTPSGAVLDPQGQQSPTINQDP